MATARSYFGLCGLSGGELYAIGGEDVNDEPLASVERYNPDLDTWSAAPSLPRPRSSHCACTVGDALYVLSGIEKDEARGEITVSSVLKFDSRTQTWSEVAPMPAERDNAGACVLGSNIYIFGGRNDAMGKTSTTYRFSTETNEWATLAPMPNVLSGHCVCVVDGLIYVLGGSKSNNNHTSSVHRFDHVANVWSAVAPMSAPRMALGSFVLDGSIYVLGGFDGKHRLFSMERYSVASDSWSDVDGGELGTARSTFCVHVVRLEVDLFNSLIAKAKSEGL
jgi:N-acetylneuraminic acid mutarotase